jgi:uncharacterized transporter YbjL
MLEYITNIYILPLIATIIGLIIVFIYDKFEKKQYTGANYFRFAILIYIATFSSLYLVHLASSKLSAGTSITGMFGGGLANGESTGTSSQNPLSTMNEYSKMHLEQFKTGTPTF